MWNHFLVGQNHSHLCLNVQRHVGEFGSKTYVRCKSFCFWSLIVRVLQIEMIHQGSIDLSL